MAELAASIIGIVSAGTKVTLVLSQLAADVGSAAKEARMIASEIRTFCAVVQTLGDTLAKVQNSKYFAHCIEMTKDMTDASLEMFTEILKASEDMLKISKGKDGKFGLKGRVQWAIFEKPKITLLRAALEAYKSNLALMLGTLNTAEKVTRRMSLQITPDVIAEDERDRALLQSLENEHRASLIDVNEVHRQLKEDADRNPEEVDLSADHSSDTEPPSDAADVGFAPLNDSSTDSLLESALLEIASIRTSLSRASAFDSDVVQEQISRYSKSLSQLMSEDQHRLSQRWSSVLAPEFAKQGTPTLPSHLDPRRTSFWTFTSSLAERNPQSTYSDKSPQLPRTPMPHVPTVSANVSQPALPGLPSPALSSDRRLSILSDSFYDIVRTWLMEKPMNDRRIIVGTLMNEVCTVTPKSPGTNIFPQQVRSPSQDARIDRKKSKEIDLVVQQQMKDFSERTEAEGATDSTPMRDLPGLTIDLGHLQMDSLPQHIVDVIHRAVERLSLSSNRFNRLPESITMCQTLRYLNLRDNRFEAVPPPVLELPLLEILDMSKNRLTAIPETISKLRQLKVLAVSKNSITRLPYALVGMDQLIILKFDKNPIEFPPLAGLEAWMRSRASSRTYKNDDHKTMDRTACVKMYIRALKDLDTSPGEEDNFREHPVYGTRPSRYPVVPSTLAAASAPWSKDNNVERSPKYDRHLPSLSPIWGPDAEVQDSNIQSISTTSPSTHLTKLASAENITKTADVPQVPASRQLGTVTISASGSPSPVKLSAHRLYHFFSAPSQP